MADSQHQQNWQRIYDEMTNAVNAIPGPVPDRTWDEFGGEEARALFLSTVEGVLAAELDARAGEESQVNVAIKDHLVELGRGLAARAGQQEDDSDV